MNDVEFRRFVKVRLAEMGWSQKDLAIHTGIAESTISAILNGSRPYPSVRTLNKMATALGCKPEELYKFVD